MPLTKSQREQRKIEDAYRLQRQRATRSPCKFHPAWRIPADQPPPHNPQASCPECAAEVIALRESPQGPVRKIDPGSAGGKLDLRYELFRERHGSPTSGPEPGSYEEDAALRKIIDARYAEEAREAEKSDGRPRGGVLVSARPVGGRWIETYKVGRRLVRVGPEG
jgi:hypothetical protein